jgi:hypothetical protein
MTGFPDHPGGGPERDRPDPEEPLLRQPPGYLAAPPGAFDQIRRRAAWRRRTRAMGGGLAAAVVLTGSLYLVGALSGRDSDDAVSRPATNSLTSLAPTTSGPATPAAAPPPPTRAGGGRSTDVPSSPATTTGSSPTGTPTADGRPNGATPMCTTSQLTASLGGGDAGAGSLFRYLLLTNNSSTTCHLTGYPGVSLLDSGGKQIGAPATRRQLRYAPVVLRPGESASDTIRTVNQQGACLPASAKLRIYPPGNTASLDIPGRVTNCDDLFVITPLTAGGTGNPPS